MAKVEDIAGDREREIHVFVLCYRKPIGCIVYMVYLEEVRDNPGNFYICEYSLSGSFSGAFRRDLKST